MRIFNVLAVLILTAPVIALAQSNFKNGSIITTAGDTINGLVDLKEWQKTPQSINFKRSESQKSETFNTASLNGFAITGIEAYEKFTTSVSLNETDFKSMPDRQDTTLEIRTVFLKILEKGPRVSLYSYTDKIKTRFYVLKNGDKDSINELLYRPYIKDSRIINSPVYNNQLLSLINEYGLSSPKIENRLKTSQYDEKDILYIIRYINGIAAPAKTNKTMPRFFAGISINQSRMKYYGDHPMAEGKVTNESQILPGISVGMDAFRNKNVQKLILRMEGRASLSDVSVSKQNSTYNNSTLVHHIKYLNLSITPQLIHNIYNRAQFKAFIGGGVSVNYIDIIKNDYFQKYQYTEFARKTNMDLKKWIYTFPVKVGTVVNKKFELYLSHSFPMPISNYMFYSIYIPETSVGVNYLFNKRK